MKKMAHAPSSRHAVIRRASLLFIAFVLALGIAWPDGTNTAIYGLNRLLRTNIPYVQLPLVLGLDLQGGARLEYVADLSNIPESEKASAMEGVRDVIERRVNSLGVSEPLVQSVKAGNEWRMAVELAGIRDINEAIRVIGETPTLDFREENKEAGRSLTDDEQKKLDEQNTEIKKKAEDAFQRVKKGEVTLEALARAESDITVSRENGGDLGWLSAEPIYRGLADRLRNTEAGKLYEGVVDDGGTLYVAQVLEQKDNGGEVRASHILIQWAGAASSPSTSTKEEARVRIEALKKQITPQNFDALARQYSEESGAAQGGGDLDWFGRDAMVQPFDEAVFALAKGAISDIVETEFGFHLIHKTDERPSTDMRVRVVAYAKKQPSDIINTEPWQRTTLTGKQLKRAQLDFDQRTGQSQVSLQFDDEGTKLFAELTKKNIGKAIGIFLDDQPISVPVVNQEIVGGQAVITGSFSIAEAKLLAQRLQAGALPVPISIIAQQSVGPTLGSESVAASVRAGLFGFLFVALFMLALYRIPGLMSVMALGFYAAVVIALFKIIPVTLTLSGIAGFILSLGIAVDANVLIFERLKEELRAGKSMSAALDEAFRRAWLSIRDGNATTLISCAVLYWFSSSIIKGFALTLALGVLTSMFSAIVVTRLLLHLVARPRIVAKVPWLFLSK